MLDSAKHILCICWDSHGFPCLVCYMVDSLITFLLRFLPIHSSTSLWLLCKVLVDQTGALSCRLTSLPLLVIIHCDLGRDYRLPKTKRKGREDSHLFVCAMLTFTNLFKMCCKNVQVLSLLFAFMSPGPSLWREHLSPAACFLELIREGRMDNFFS